MNTKTPPELFNQLKILIKKGDSASYHPFFWTTDFGLRSLKLNAALLKVERLNAALLKVERLNAALFKVES